MECLLFICSQYNRQRLLRLAGRVLISCDAERIKVLTVATVIERHANAMVVPMAGCALSGSLELGSRFRVGAFGRNQASVAPEDQKCFATRMSLAHSRYRAKELTDILHTKTEDMSNKFFVRDSC